MSDSDFNLSSPVIYQTVGGAVGDGSLDGALTVQAATSDAQFNNGIQSTPLVQFGASKHVFLQVYADGVDLSILNPLGGWYYFDPTMAFHSRIAQYQSIDTLGMGVAPIYGLDNREGLTAADASPITIYATPAGSNGLFRISGGLDVTAYTSGTVTYTITWTDVNGAAHTKTASLSAVGHADLNALGLERVKGGTNITVQLTGTFVATVSVDAASEQAA